MLRRINLFRYQEDMDQIFALKYNSLCAYFQCKKNDCTIYTICVQLFRATLTVNI